MARLGAAPRADKWRRRLRAGEAGHETTAGSTSVTVAGPATPPNPVVERLLGSRRPGDVGAPVPMTPDASVHDLGGGCATVAEARPLSPRGSGWRNVAPGVVLGVVRGARAFRFAPNIPWARVIYRSTRDAQSAGRRKRPSTLRGGSIWEARSLAAMIAIPHRASMPGPGCARVAACALCSVHYRGVPL